MPPHTYRVHILSHEGPKAATLPYETDAPAATPTLHQRL